MRLLVALLIIATVGCDQRAATVSARADLEALRQENAQLQNELAAARKVQPPTAKKPIVLSGNLFGGNLDEQLFRACATLEKDGDARNAFLYAQNKLWEYRDLDDGAKVDTEIKLVIDYQVEMSLDAETVRITIRRN